MEGIYAFDYIKKQTKKTVPGEIKYRIDINTHYSTVA